MKAELTIEQSQRLIELGVNADKASKSSGITSLGYGIRGVVKTPPKPVFTLADLLSLWPKKRDGYYLSITAVLADVDSMEICDGWMVCYVSDELKAESQDSIFYSPELIDALYELVVWAITNKHIKL